MFFNPRKSDVVEKALNVPFQDPGGGGLLPQCFETLVNGIRTPALGPKPIGIVIRLGFRKGLQRLEIESLSRPIVQGRDRQRTLFAVLLGDVDPFQGLRLVLPPLPDPGYRCGFLFGGLPAFAIHARGLLAPILGHSFDG